jgi:hypothetical protein
MIWLFRRISSTAPTIQMTPPTKRRPQPMRGGRAAWTPALALGPRSAPHQLEKEGLRAMSNVVNLADHRRQTGLLTEDEIAAMHFTDAWTWAGADFDRLVIVAKAKDYRPEWVRYQIEKHGRDLTASEVETLQRMIVAAGPYVPPKLRWLLRNLKRYKTGAELIGAAARSVEYRQLVYTAAGVDRDIGKLLDMGFEIDATIAAEIKAIAADCRKTKNRPKEPAPRRAPRL